MSGVQVMNDCCREHLIRHMERWINPPILGFVPDERYMEQDFKIKTLEREVSWFKMWSVVFGFVTLVLTIALLLL